MDETSRDDNADNTTDNPPVAVPSTGMQEEGNPVEGSGELNIPDTPDEDIFLIEEPNNFQTFATATDIELAVSITGANQTVKLNKYFGNAFAVDR
ncbi:MAG: hypothetical protein LBP53_03610 [Candidatus Peribacteria bacterium]|nr:hypothetical protein [Candidatus Peribacteria bacterium]